MLATRVSSITWSVLSANRGVARLVSRANTSTSSDRKPDKPNNREHLVKVHHELSESLPAFFTRPHCYYIYSQSVILEDNIRHLKTLGLANYVKQLNMVKFWANFKYSHKDLVVLKITEHPEDMTVRVRWRIVGTPGISSLLFFTFWRYKPFNKKENLTKDRTEWTDGFSIFHVNSEGLVDKHIVEKIMPDDDRLSTGGKPGLTNLAFIVGLMPDTLDLIHYGLHRVGQLVLVVCNLGIPVNSV